MAEPKIVVDAVLSEGLAQEQQIKLYPVTIRRYALLEKLKSPFIFADAEFNVNNVVPTAFVMSRTPDELKTYCTKPSEDVVQAAFDWAESLDIDDLPKMLSALSDQFLALNKAAPDKTTGQDVKKNPS